MSRCSHDGFHSGVGRYCADTGRMRYVVVCDECQTEMSEVHAEDYRPAFDPAGNSARDRAA